MMCAENVITPSSFVRFKGGLLNTYTSPSIGFCAINGEIGFYIDIINNDYPKHIKPNNGRLMIKFSNDSIITLNVVLVLDVSKEYVSSTRFSSSFWRYTCGALYELSDDDIQKLLTLDIIKFRIELENGEYYDGNTTPERAQKNTKKLNNSYCEMQQKQDKRENVANGNGFVEDF